MTGSGRPAVRSERVDGAPVRVLEQGTGRAIVLVHGLGLDAGVWKPHLPLLAAAGYRVIAPDLPGFGESPGPFWGQSVRQTAAWLGRFADALGIGQVTWVGHSIAAQHLVRLASTEPARVAALVLAAPTGRTGRHGLRQLGGLLVDAFRERPRLVGGVIRRYLGAPAATLGTWLRSLGHAVARDAAVVDAPTLLVRGGDDPVVPSHFIARLERLLGDARAIRIEDAAHAVAIDPPGAFVEVVLDFLADRYPGATG